MTKDQLSSNLNSLRAAITRYSYGESHGNRGLYAGKQEKVVEDLVCCLDKWLVSINDN